MNSASELVNGQARDPVLTSGFLIILANSAAKAGKKFKPPYSHPPVDLREGRERDDGRRMAI